MMKANAWLVENIKNVYQLGSNLRCQTNSLGFAVDLVLFAQVRAARLLALQRVPAHQLAELEIIGDAPGLLELGIESVGAARHHDVAPELRAQVADGSDGGLQTCSAATDAAVVPQEVAELAMERVDRAAAAAA